MYLWKCCYLYISPVHFIERDITVENCVDRCSSVDKFAAIGNIKYERDTSGIITVVALVTIRFYLYGNCNKDLEGRIHIFEIVAYLSNRI